jgi:hypothetical protein
MPDMESLREEDVKYNEEENCFIIKTSKTNIKWADANSITLVLPVDAFSMELGKILKIPQYKKWLWKKQDKKCAVCGKTPFRYVGKNTIIDYIPSLGKPGSKAVDYGGKTQNRVICVSCYGTLYSMMIM